MNKFTVFVGREWELDLIDQWVEKRDTTHMIAIQGGGGVGKTRLLREIQGRYEQLEDVIVIYWDYAERPITGLSQINAVYRDLGISGSKFRDDLAELERKAYDWDPAEYERRESQLFQTAIDELRGLLKNRRMIYMMDTTEFMTTSTERTDQFASQLPNSLFIAAGRNITTEKLPSFEQIYGAQNVTPIELHNFNEVESAQFFDQVDKNDFIASDMRDKLYFLTNGRPILLSLAVEWLSRDVPLPEIAEQPLEALKALPEQKLNNLHKQFAFELVSQVRTLKEPLDRAVLYMAHLSRRNDVDILATSMDISKAEAKKLVEYLRELSFVRYNPATGNCTLHDEMRLLVNQYAWPYVDPSGKVRRRLAGKIITQYYEKRIAKLAHKVKAKLESDRGPIHRRTISDDEWEQWRLEAECLHYHLKVGEQEGLTYFETRFAEAQRNNHLMRIESLLSEMEVSGHPGIRNTVELRKAESLHLRGELEQSSAICHNLLARPDLSPDNRIGAHNILGVIAASTDPEQARRQYESALQLAQDANKTRVIGVLHNNLGQLDMLTGQMEGAIQHYQQAIEASKQAGNRPLVASATNNLAYVHRRLGDLAQADVLCRVGLAQRKRLGVERDIAYSYLTKGEIDRDRGDLESAERYTKLALRSFDKVDEVRGQINAYRSLANIRRHMEQYEEAGMYLERGIALAEHIHNEPLLSSLLNVYGRQQRDRAFYLQEIGDETLLETSRELYRSAEEFLERSLNLAEQYGDQWMLTRSQFELALAYFLSASRPDEYVIERLDRVWEGATRLKYTLLQGYIEENRGEISQRQQDYAAAAQHFGLAAQIVARLSGRESERFFDRIGDRLLDTRLSVETVHTLARGILDVIREPVESETVKSLQSLQLLCQQVLDLS